GGGTGILLFSLKSPKFEGGRREQRRDRSMQWSPHIYKGTRARRDEDATTLLPRMPHLHGKSKKEGNGIKR
ncbi:hypothetical protein, partial [Porphyromonas sp.]